jgi:rhomboid family GlyGly-CTERM serine protease
MSAEAFKATLSQFKITLLTALVLCFCNAGFLLGDTQAPWFRTLNTLMQFDRAAILKGEIWRLFTGHLVHWSAEHFYLDALVFVAQGIVFEPRIGRAYARVLGIAGGAISLSLLLFQSDLAAYRGISGLINTQLVLGTGLFVFDPDLKRSVNAFYLAVLSVHMFKIAYETVFKVPFFVTDALGDMGLFTPLAHLGGVMVGLYYLLGSIRAGAKTRPRLEIPKNGFTSPGPPRD